MKISNINKSDRTTFSSPMTPHHLKEACMSPWSQAELYTALWWRVGKRAAKALCACGKGTGAHGVGVGCNVALGREVVVSQLLRIAFSVNLSRHTSRAPRDCHLTAMPLLRGSVLEPFDHTDNIIHFEAGTVAVQTNLGIAAWCLYRSQAHKSIQFFIAWFEGSGGRGRPPCPTCTWKYHRNVSMRITRKTQQKHCRNRCSRCARNRRLKQGRASIAPTLGGGR